MNKLLLIYTLITCTEYLSLFLIVSLLPTSLGANSPVLDNLLISLIHTFLICTLSGLLHDICRSLQCGVINSK